MDRKKQVNPQPKNPSTVCTHFAEDPSRHLGAIVPPIFLNSLFAYDEYESIQEAFRDRQNHYIYTRGLNPTVETVERKIAALEGGQACKLMGSGMAAISSAIMTHVSAGDHVLCVQSAYPVTYRLLTEYLPRFGVAADFVDGTDIESVERAIRPSTRVLYLESPTSMTFQVHDLTRLSELAHQKGVATVIDNSWSSPIFQRPIELGIDMVVHSATKYLGGHSDVVAGAVIGSSEAIARLTDFEQAILGGILGPFEAWLILRGLRTLPIRMQRHQESALQIARFLESHPRVTRVNYPGLPSHPQYDLARRQMSGFSGLMSFELDTDEPGVRRFVNALNLFRIGVSWGGFESLVYAPIISLSMEMTPEQRLKAGISDGMVRIHVGLEDAADLVDDLEQALAML